MTLSTYGKQGRVTKGEVQKVGEVEKKTNKNKKPKTKGGVQCLFDGSRRPSRSHSCAGGNQGAVPYCEYDIFIFALSSCPSPFNLIVAFARF